MAQAGELVVAVYSRSSKRASWGSLALQLPYGVLKTPQSGCYYVRFVHSPSPYQPLLPARSTLVTSHLWASRFAHPVLEFDARPHLRSRGGPSRPAPVEGIAGQPRGIGAKLAIVATMATRRLSVSSMLRSYFLR